MSAGADETRPPGEGERHDRPVPAVRALRDLPDLRDLRDLPDLRDVVAAQLGRAPRAMQRVAHKCSCGLPDVVETAPRLPDGTPFPTLFYLTCPRAAAAVGRLESSGLMRRMNQRLATDPDLAAGYASAHEDYLRRRNNLERLRGDPGVGGMPGRVKCLHALVAHSLAVGPGVNPLGDETLTLLADWGAGGPCVHVPNEDGST